MSIIGVQILLVLGVVGVLTIVSRQNAKARQMQPIKVRVTEKRRR